MSRLAKRPIDLPKGVELKVVNNVAQVKGPKGSASFQLEKGLVVKIESGKVNLILEKDSKIQSEIYGLNWALLRNKIVGVSEGFEKRLAMIGVGYRAAVKGTKLDVQVGFSHPTELDIPKDIKVVIDKSGDIIISGIDKHLVGQFAASVRAMKPPEPYKGKGIRYKDEYVRKKAGKAAKAKA
jgi:large subunit ribosomal protein L6